MPIPDLTADGILPPFVGPSGAAGSPQNLSPYPATALEVINRFRCTIHRKSILKGWLAHRADLRKAGFDRGFQWLDGSFVENKDPKDLDVVTYLYRPAWIHDPISLSSHMRDNHELFQRAIVRKNYSLDFFSIDLDGSPEFILKISSYFLSLFSHRRNDQLWKGMLQVRLEDPKDDQAALIALESASTS